MTLTLKHQMRAADGRAVGLDELLAKKNFRHFMKLLNRTVFGNANRNHDKRLLVIPALEKDVHGRWHYHLAIEPPAHMGPEFFQVEIWTCWRRTFWGHDQMHFSATGNDHWLDYMLKIRQAGKIYLPAVQSSASEQEARS